MQQVSEELEESSVKIFLLEQQKNITYSYVHSWVEQKAEVVTNRLFKIYSIHTCYSMACAQLDKHLIIALFVRQYSI